MPAPSTVTWRGATARQWIADPLWAVWALAAAGVALAIGGILVGATGWLVGALLAVAAMVAALALSGST